MSWNHGLPFLPGNTFRDVTKSAFHRPQTLDFKNGYAFPHKPTVGVEQDPLLSEQLNQQEISEFSSTPDVSYGSFEQSVVEEFIPAYVALDKKVLRYYAYFCENIPFSAEEEFRVRPVVINYYLEDDTMSMVEPMVENSGMPQGKRVSRQRLPNNEHGQYYQWTDLNIGMDLEVYGFKYHITHCDAFTKKFLESEGFVLNDPEPMPQGKRRKNPQPSQPSAYTTPSQFDSSYQFLTMDPKVLRFFALWEDADSLFGENRPVTIQYYLADDTVGVSVVREPNSGRDPFPVLMHRLKLPKKIKPGSETFPSCVLEASTAEVDEYYSPKDFHVGQTIKLMGRRFLLYDCDGFTKEYYQKNHPDMAIKPSGVPKKTDLLQKRKDSQNLSDEDRCFILSYFLSDDMISIFEKPVPGIIGGQVLKKTHIPKPGSTADKPEFYSPADLAIGATVKVFSRRFVLTNADHFVLTYLESSARQIPCQTLDSLRQKLGVATANNQQADQNGDDVAEPSSLCEGRLDCLKSYSLPNK
uniref:EF-hand domain (C-terminal) containing 1 n=1 Tax=Sander lucioperca TaxID=283035 RepID=A0A8C9XNJ5_SANLU